MCGAHGAREFVRKTPIRAAANFLLIVEPLEGLDLATLAGRKGVWFSTARMYETTRAIDAGRAVLEETLHPLLANPPNL